MNPPGGDDRTGPPSAPSADVTGLLRDHVAAVLAEAHTPAGLRTELAEELYGHLLERWEALVAGGVAPDEAAHRAIRTFGRPAEVGRELTRSFHGRLWASTIGVLIPGDTRIDETRPGLIGWLRLGVAIEAVLMLLGVAAALADPPLQALLAGVPAAASFFLLIGAYIALGRGRRWALHVAVVALLGDLFEWFTAPHPPGVFISFTGLLAVALLFAIWNTQLGAGPWFERGARPGKWSTLGLAGIVAVAHAGYAVGPVIGDPTQVTARDLDLRLVVVCGPSPDEVGFQAMTATVTLTWARHDLVPNGLVNAFSGPRDSDAMSVKAIWVDGPPIDPDVPSNWALTDSPPNQPWLEPGYESSPDAGARVTLEPPIDQTDDPLGIGIVDPTIAAPGFPAGILPDLMAPGHAYSATWRFGQLAPVPWPSIVVRYVHDYRFAFEASAACGETAVGHPAP